MASSKLNMRGYSCPHEELDALLLDQIASIHAREVLRRFLNRYSERLRRSGSGIFEILSSSLEQPTSFSVVWDPAFAYCRAAILQPECQDATNVAASVALRLAAEGLPSEWQLTLDDTATHLRWGNWLLPKAERISVFSDGRTAEVRVRAGSSSQIVRFVRANQDWGGEGASRLSTFGSNQAPIALWTKEILGPRDTYQLPAEVEDHIDIEFVGACAGAFHIMAKYAPIYATWVERAVRHVVLLRRKAGEEYNYSGSSSGDYGLIHACAMRDPVAIAEILVHEAAHQYYYLLCRLGPVDDSTDNHQYYSPLVRTKRPIDRILLAYHAVGNIILFARLLKDHGASQAETFSPEQESKLYDELEQLEGPLRDNRALTIVGRAILNPLIENIHRASWGSMKL